MKIAFASAILLGSLLLVSCLLAISCHAQDTSRFQSVGGDYGKNVIGTIKSNESQTTAANDNGGSLWSWGSAPKGSMILDGNLMTNPLYAAKGLKVINNWMGDSFVDPYGDSPEYTYTDPETGEYVKVNTDPNSGQSYYTYKDSKTGKLVYVYFDPITGVPYYVGLSPPAGTIAPANDSSLPPVFSSSYPWS